MRCAMGAAERGEGEGESKVDESKFSPLVGKSTFTIEMSQLKLFPCFLTSFQTLKSKVFKCGKSSNVMNNNNTMCDGEVVASPRYLLGSYEVSLINFTSTIYVLLSSDPGGADALLSGGQNSVHTYVRPPKNH